MNPQDVTDLLKSKGYLTAEQAEEVIRGTGQPYPQHREDDKWLVWGRTRAGDLLQVVYILDEDDSIYVIHARPLTTREKRRFRRIQQ